MPRREYALHELTAVSPLDGRYRQKVKGLVPFSSEMALMQARADLEARYLLGLSREGVIRPISGNERRFLLGLGPNMILRDAQMIKDIETKGILEKTAGGLKEIPKTNHDVKAIEYYMRFKFGGTSLEDLREWIHYGLTSEDINNNAYRMMFVGGINTSVLPVLANVVNALSTRADATKRLPFKGQTHGQDAVPTTMGKEVANFAVRLDRQVNKVKGIRMTGKLNGAVGNYNALTYASPEVDWIGFSKRFVAGLGFEPNLFTTQINPNEDIIEMFQAFQRINGVFLDLNQDHWLYISKDWFAQKVVAGEIGSSTMPQKVNPIDFENSEGNIYLAEGLIDGIRRKLSVSRLQRDLSDSVVMRHAVSTALAFCLLEYKSTLTGLGKAYPNPTKVHEDLHTNWTILSEGVQTLLRRLGNDNPYKMMAEETRGKKIGETEWRELIAKLDVTPQVMDQLVTLTPDSYIGKAVELTEMALEEIHASRT